MSLHPHRECIVSGCPHFCFATWHPAAWEPARAVWCSSSMGCGAGIRADSIYFLRNWRLVASDGLASPFAQVHPWPLHTDNPILESCRLALPLPGLLSALWKHTGLQHPLAAGKTPLQVQILLSLRLAKDLLFQAKSWSCVSSVSTAIVTPSPTPRGSHSNTLLFRNDRDEWDPGSPTSTRKQRVSNRVSRCLDPKCQPIL